MTEDDNMNTISSKAAVLLTVLMLTFTGAAAQTAVSATAKAALDAAASRMDSDFGIEATVTISNDSGIDMLQNGQGTLKMDGVKYAFLFNDMSIWFDGATQWTLQNGDYQEIYISDPSPEESLMLNPVLILKSGKLFNPTGIRDVTANGKNAVEITLVPSDNDTYPGLSQIVVTLDKATSRPVKATVLFSEAGNITLTFNRYRTGVSFSGSDFICKVSDYKDADVIDMR